MVSDGGFVRSVDRVAALLELLSARKAPMRLIEIAQDLDLPKSTAHGILQTLQAKGFIVRDQNQRYRLSLRLFSLAASALEIVDLPELARPAMEQASQETGLTCNLAVLDDHDVLYIEKVEARDGVVRLVTHVGTRIPAHQTALGHVLVGSMPADEQEEWLSRHVFEKATEKTCPDAESYRKVLQKQAKVGYAVDDQGLHAAVTGFAAPVRDRSGRVIAALSLSQLGPQVAAATKRELGQRVLEAAESVTAVLATR
ncbi:Transcriptional regulator kdgR [Brevibacterium casei]|uniref:Glycerol operon regulatory protein n=1 Tax=Brevibacterium casei TaxID=33889 RepID=A0A449CZE8_9MICO|nr:Transcriptional regulator kdgR [Brevibacterium casei]